MKAFYDKTNSVCPGDVCKVLKDGTIAPMEQIDSKDTTGWVALEKRMGMWICAQLGGSDRLLFKIQDDS